MSIPLRKRHAGTVPEFLISIRSRGRVPKRLRASLSNVKNSKHAKFRWKASCLASYDMELNCLASDTGRMNLIGVPRISLKVRRSKVPPYGKRGHSMLVCPMYYISMACTRFKATARFLTS